MSTPKTTVPTSTKPDTSAWASAGRNVRFQTLEGMLFIAIDVSEGVLKAAPASGSGKSKSVGSTLGNVAVPGTPIKIGVNAYMPNG